MVMVGACFIFSKSARTQTIVAMELRRRDKGNRFKFSSTATSPFLLCEGKNVFVDLNDFILSVSNRKEDQLV